MAPINKGIGAPVRRVEDERFLRGLGRYTDDLYPRDTAFAYVVRSPHAHAVIRRIDTTRARSAPAVLSVLTSEDVIREKLGGLPCVWPPRSTVGTPFIPEQPLLATRKVRYVGDPVALVVAETLNAAKDAAERLVIDYEPLPAMTLTDAVAENATRIWDEARSNVSFELEFGDHRAVNEQFAAARHIAKIAIHYPRINASPIEPRSALAYRDSDGRFTLVSATQDPFQVRCLISKILRIPDFDIKVHALDVGGSFGLKGQVYPEEMLIVWAAGRLGRAVKWTGERAESFASDMHARHQINRAEMALDDSGRILALRNTAIVEIGAYPGLAAGIAPMTAASSYPGPYKIPAMHSTIRAAFTNTSQTGPYRGTGKPQATFVLERLIETAATQMGIDAIELRRRNLIRQSDMPFRTCTGRTYDCGDFERVLDQGLTLSQWQGFAARRANSEQRGLRRGIGLALHCHNAGLASERMEIRIAENGSVAVYAGTFSTGQGHETMFAQMICSWLGVPIEEVRVFHGSTDRALFGRGSFAQRTMSAGGAALKVAADEVIRKARRIAAWLMEVAEVDIVFENGHFHVAGTDRELSLREVAEKSYMPLGLPSELGVGLDGIGTDPGPGTYPNGCMIAEVELDPETGFVKVERLWSVDDTGTVINPLTLDGQLHGSIAHGLGEALLESIVYEPNTGQLLTASFMDYAMPRADVMPEIFSELAPVPTKGNPLGAKGGSEAGNAAAPVAVINAVLDALSPWGITDIPVPARPEQIWRAISDASRNSAGKRAC